MASLAKCGTWASEFIADGMDPTSGEFTLLPLVTCFGVESLLKRNFLRLREDILLRVC